VSKIHNSVYGLALGDALGYRTEFLNFKNALDTVGSIDFESIDKKLNISDDTQMSLYLIEGFKQAYQQSLPYAEQSGEIIRSVAKQFLLWLHDPENIRAPGNACISSLRYMERNFSVEDDPIEIILQSSSPNRESKGSGTVMRSPWIGLLHAEGIIPEQDFKTFCYQQSMLTHRHPTALHAAYLGSLLTSKLYTNELHPGQLQEFCLYVCDKKINIPGWEELKEDFSATKYLPKDYDSSHFSQYDPSGYLGKDGKASTVLVTAVAMVDRFGHNPLEVMRRCVFNSGDSDTIAAVAGGILGACYEDNIWESVESIIESAYVPWLDETIVYLESLNS
jgi:ADP-ribosylglycohydrolase